MVSSILPVPEQPDITAGTGMKGLPPPTVVVWCCHRSAQEFAKAATAVYTALMVAVNVSLILRPGELDLVSNPPWMRVAAVMAVFTFFDGVRRLLAQAFARCGCHEHRSDTVQQRRGSSLQLGPKALEWHFNH